MGLRASLSKMFGPGVPLDIAVAENAQGMDANTAFSPGAPIGPYRGFDGVPRKYDFTTGVNINSRPRSSERIPFSTLRGLVDAYDVAQACIWHRLDSVRSLEYSIVPKKGATGDLDGQIALAERIMAKPNGQTPFSSWIAPYLYDVLAFDAGCFTRIRNNAGRVIGLDYIDGTTIAPMIDGWGRTPTPPMAAYVQYANGVPWEWLTTDDLIYTPFRLRSNSVYGLPALETVLLNANTDLRFQSYFLQKFTDGNVPAAFMMSPESWTPDQIIAMQAAWDAYMLGDQSKMSQVRWIPGGTGVAWSNEKDFTDDFSLFLMRKTCAAFHVVPTDLGFTETANKSSGDTQADVQFRIGDKPLVEHVQGIFSRFLQDDLGLSVELQFDTGRETEDRLATAQVNDIYIKNGTLSVSYVAEKEFGLSEPDGQIVPRFIFSDREGPIPLSSLSAVAGPVDPETGAPLPGAALPTQVFQGVQGVIATPPPAVDPLAVQENGVSALPPPALTAVPVAKATADACNDEMAAFQRFAKARQRSGKWRDFEFVHIEASAAAELNRRAAMLAKAVGPSMAGLCVFAVDTGNVLMGRRSADSGDPASGMLEFPGGHLLAGEGVDAGAVREWCEETGLTFDMGSAAIGGRWISPDGVYAGLVCRIRQEGNIGPAESWPDSDGDRFPETEWVDPDDLIARDDIRSELRRDVEAVLNAIRTEDPAATGEVVKDAPKVGTWRDGPADTPHATYDLTLTDYYSPKITAALNELWSDAQLTAAVTGTLAKASPLPTPDEGNLDELIRLLVADALYAGAHAATTQVGSGAVKIGPLLQAEINWSTWAPGHPDAAALVSDGAFADLLDGAGVTVQGIVGTLLDDMGDRIGAGLTAGDPSDKIASSLRDMLDDPSRADRIAHTEVARAMSQASLNVYGVNGIGQFDLITSAGACPACMDAASGNPHDLSDTASSAPLHPFCRCADAPHV